MSLHEHLPVIPLFTPQAGDVNQVVKNTEIIDMTGRGSPAINLGNAVEEFLVGPINVGVNPNLARYHNRLNDGGTLTTREVNDLSQQNTDISVAVTALKTRLGHRPDSPISIKAYKDRKAGLAPHRDANFVDSGPASVVDAIGLRGTREFALWAVPQTVELDLADADFMRISDRAKAIVEFAAHLDGKPYLFRPVKTETFGPGKGVRIDEQNGVWKQPPPSNRQMAVWHSVYGVASEDGRPVLSAVIRSHSPRPLPAKK